MPSVSKAQQRFMGMVHAAQKGELDNPSKDVKDAAKSMKKKDAKDFASTKHKNLPDKVKKESLIDYIPIKESPNRKKGELLKKVAQDNKKAMDALIDKVMKKYHVSYDIAAYALYQIVDRGRHVSQYTIGESVSNVTQEVNRFVNMLNSKFGNKDFMYDVKFSSKYAKIIMYANTSHESVWGFIALVDNPSKGYRTGDLLKAAGWSTPSRIARGNIIDKTARFDKYSPAYLKM